jgi:nucleotide-binding universal stress UspA family protein
VKRIVVGLDGTQKDFDIVDWVADFVLDTGVQVVAAHFVPRASLWMISGAQIDSARYLDELRKHLDDGVMQRLRSRVGSVHLQVEPGDPATELAGLARRSEADLIAIGAPEHSAVHDVVFGSTERRLAHHAGVPVVTIPCGCRPLRLVH